MQKMKADSLADLVNMARKKYNRCLLQTSKYQKHQKSVLILLVAVVPAQSQNFSGSETMPAGELNAWRPEYQKRIRQACDFHDRCAGGVGSPALLLRGLVRRWDHSLPLYFRDIRTSPVAGWLQDSRRDGSKRDASGRLLRSP